MTTFLGWSPKTLLVSQSKDPVVSVKNTRGSQLWTLLVHSKNTLLVHSQRPCGFSKKTDVTSVMLLTSL